MFVLSICINEAYVCRQAMCGQHYINLTMKFIAAKFTISHPCMKLDLDMSKLQFSQLVSHWLLCVSK